MSIVDDCRRILSEAKPSNDNYGELRLLPQKRVDELLRQLNGIKARGHIYEPNGFSEPVRAIKFG